MAGSRLIPVRIGAITIEAEAVPLPGLDSSSGRVARPSRHVEEVFDRAQEAIVEVARSTARMIELAGQAARPDQLEVEFGLRFSAAGGVILAGIAGEASLKVTMTYDASSRANALQA